MTTPLFSRPPITLYCGDAVHMLATGLNLPPIAITCTDPPYSSGGLYRADRTQATPAKYVRGNTDSTDTYAAFSGDNRDQRAYFAWLSYWLSLAFWRTLPSGIVCLFTDWRQLGTTVDAVQAAGFVYRGIVPWNKTEAARPAKGRFRNQCEYVVWGSAGPLGLENDNDDKRPCLPGLITCPTDRDKTHIAQKPVAVFRQLLEITPPGGIVFDPFAGSGASLKAAHLLGLEAVGIECDRNTADIAAFQLDHFTRQKRLEIPDGAAPPPPEENGQKRLALTAEND